MNFIKAWFYQITTGLLLVVALGLLFNRMSLLRDIDKTAVAHSEHLLEDEKTKARQAIELGKSAQKLADAQAALQTLTDNSKGKLSVETNNLSAQRDDLAKRLRLAQANLATAKLVSTTSTVAGPDPTPLGSEVAILHGTPGYDVVSEAHRADLLRAHYQACEEQYRAAASILDKLRAEAVKP